MEMSTWVIKLALDEVESLATAPSLEVVRYLLFSYGNLEPALWVEAMRARWEEKEAPPP